LDKTEYIYVRNKVSGEITMEKGPLLFIPPSPYHVIERRLKAIPLKLHECVKILDRETGKIRVEKGIQTVYLTPFEEAIAPFGKKGKRKKKIIQQAVNIDEHTAVLIRNTENGQQFLITEKSLFFPGPYEEIIEIQKKIILRDNETIILKDKVGNYHFLTSNSESNPISLDFEEPEGGKKKKKKGKKGIKVQEPLL